MKTLTILLTLTFTVMFSSPSFADWKKVSESVDGDTFYVDFERIRKHGGYVYWWYLTDYMKPTQPEHLYSKVYDQGHYKSFRRNGLSYS